MPASVESEDSSGSRDSIPRIGREFSTNSGYDLSKVNVVEWVGRQVDHLQGVAAI